jgi:hypothetical protein
MHEVRSKLQSTAPHPTEVLSNYVLEKCKGMDIWRQKPTQEISKYIKTSPNQIKVIVPESNTNA